eukprot:2068722-Prymnesium_polylepis.1
MPTSSQFNSAPTAPSVSATFAAPTQRVAPAAAMQDLSRDRRLSTPCDSWCTANTCRSANCLGCPICGP